jgi:adenylate kinase
LVIGAPGSGKTTNAELIAKNNKNIVHYSTGNLLRDEVAKGSELGKKIDSYISKGLLCPLDIVIATVIKAIKDSKEDCVVIDGFPRSKEQANELEKFLSEESDIEIAGVIEIEVSEETAKERVLGRARGADDNIEVFKNRMKVYLEPLPEIEKIYEEKGILFKIDGERTIEEIVADVAKVVKCHT